MEKKSKCLEILKTLVSNMWYIVALVAIIAIIFLMIANSVSYTHLVRRK